MIPLDLSSASYEAPDAGIQRAVCFGVWDVGLQLNSFNNEIYPTVLIGFELEQKKSDGKAMYVYNTYTNSFSQKANLRKMMESWRGKKYTDAEILKMKETGFTIDSLVGKSCNINIIYATSKSGNEYAKIETILPLGKSEPIPITLRGFVPEKVETLRGMAVMPKQEQHKSGTMKELEKFQDNNTGFDDTPINPNEAF